jgi:sirohydrochlorin cobaltochelatase
MSGTRSRIRKAPATDRRNGGGTLVLVTHGIEGAPGSAAAHAAAIAALGRFEQVRVGCIKGRPGLAEALLDAPHPVCIVPLLMAEGFIHDLMRCRLADLPGCDAWRLASPIGCHPGLTEAIQEKAIAACRRQGWATDRTALLLIGHGTPRHHGSADATRDQARRLAGAGFAAVAAAFLEEPPLPAQAVAALPGEHVVAVGLFLDNGPHGDEDVRDALAPVGRPVACTGAIGADPALVPLILDQAAAVSPR